MKKILAIIVLGLLTISCVQNLKEFRKMDMKDRMKMFYDRDYRINLFSNDKDLLYLDTYAIRIGGKAAMSYRRESSNWLTREVYHQDIYDVARRICKTNLNKNVANFIGTRVMTKSEVKYLKLFGVEYDMFKCSKSRSEIAEEKLKKLQDEQGSNTLNRSYACKLGSEVSKIKIRGNTAKEITAVGVEINYYNVEYTSKGAFILRGSSKDPGRAWFIGAKSFLMLDANAIPFNCN